MGEQRKGLFYGVAAYLLWGLFPLYWPHLKPSGADEILAHRIVWSVVVVAVLLAARRRRIGLAALGARRLLLLATGAAVLSVNWLVYIWGVNHDQVVQTSLGYFTNPLVTVLLGVFVLRERLRPVQWAALALGAVAVVILTVDYGGLPWIALTLAFSFATYGLIKKTVSIGSLDSLGVETGWLFLPAAGYLAILAVQGRATFGSAGAGHAMLLATTGVITAIPLLCFGAAAIRVPLTTIGLLQYLAPIIQFGLGVFFFHEPMPASRVAGFALVWAALVMLAADGLRAHQQRRAPRLAVVEPA